MSLIVDDRGFGRIEDRSLVANDRSHRWVRFRTPDGMPRKRSSAKGRKAKPSEGISSTIMVVIAFVIGAGLLSGGIMLAVKKWPGNLSMGGSEKTSLATTGESTISKSEAKPGIPRERLPSDPLVKLSSPRISKDKIGRDVVEVDYKFVFRKDESNSMTMVLKFPSGEVLTSYHFGSMDARGTLGYAELWGVGRRDALGHEIKTNYKGGFEMFLVAGNIGDASQIDTQVSKISNSVTYGPVTAITLAVKRPTDAELAAEAAEADRQKQAGIAARAALLATLPKPEGYVAVPADAHLLPGAQIKVMGQTDWEDAEVMEHGPASIDRPLKIHVHGQMAAFDRTVLRSEMLITQAVLDQLKSSPASIRSEITSQEQPNAQWVTPPAHHVMVDKTLPLRPEITVKWGAATGWQDYKVVSLVNERMVKIRQVNGDKEHTVNRTEIAIDFFFWAKLRSDPNAEQTAPPFAQIPTNDENPFVPQNAESMANEIEIEIPVTVTPSDRVVTDMKALEVGQIVQVEWGGTWYLSNVVQKNGNTVRIHYRGWPSINDEDVPLSRIRLMPK